MKWKGIVFDRDGTLFDSLPVILRSFNYGIEPFTSRRPSDTEWFSAFGPAEPEVMENFIPRERKQEAFERFYRYYQEHIPEVILFPGIRQLLKRLKNNGVKLAVFTGGGRVSTRFCLEKEGILELFDELITGDDVMHHKPDPEGVLKAIELFGQTAMETVVVGDSDADILAGEKAGTATVLAAWSAAAAHHSSRADYIFKRVSDFEAFIFDGVRSS